MPYTPEQRRQLHTKQPRLQVSSGVPSLDELKEGVPVLRSTEEGVVEYIRYKGEVYKKIYTLASKGKSIPIDYAKVNHSHSVVWHDMVLENSWENYSSLYSNAAYSKDVNGFVHLKGLIKRSDSSVTADITSLPIGHRPPKIILLTGLTSSGTGAEAHHCRVNIEKDGDVYGSAGAVGDGGMDKSWVSLDGLSFYVY